MLRKLQRQTWRSFNRSLLEAFFVPTALFGTPGPACTKPRHQEVVDQLAKMQKTTEASEEKIPMAKAEERTHCL